jgi:hypothetical protein
MCCDLGGIIAMQGSSKSQNHTLVAGIARWWRNRTGNHAGRAELENFSRDELRGVAMDVGSNPQEFRSLAGKWPESSNLLLRRLSAIGLDASEIERLQPAVSNDLKRLCSLCVSKKRCDRDFVVNAENASWQEYCPNVSTLTALTAHRVVKEDNKKRQQDAHGESNFR